MTTYRNPWHDAQILGSRPFYTTEVSPVEYRGFLIYQRIHGVCWDVVKDGTALTQMAGLNGAKKAIDNLLDNSTDYWAQRMSGYLREAANA